MHGPMNVKPVHILILCFFEIQFNITSIFHSFKFYVFCYMHTYMGGAGSD